MPKRNANRGFVIIIILAVAAVITAVVVTQLGSAQKAQVSGTRAREDAQARAIAEACLDQLTQYAQDLIPTPVPGSDYDALLAGAGGNAFLPFTTRIVTIPPTAAGTLHQWNLIDIRPGSGGLCAARFDDNADDGRNALPGAGAATGAGEGPGGANNPNKDRDLAVYLTVIGLFPVTGTDANVYANAHARVTLRRLIQKTNMLQPAAPAIWASNINIANNANICGAGGLQASGSMSLANNSCACGATTEPASGCTGSGCPTSGDTCACPTSCPPATVSPGPPPAPPANIHWGVINDFGVGNMSNLLANEGWGPARANYIDPFATPQAGENVVGSPDPSPGNDIAGDGDGDGVADVCSFYATVGGDLFLWDPSDTDAYRSFADMADGLLDGTIATGPNSPLPGGGIATLWDPDGDGAYGGGAGVPVENCSNNTQDPFPAPCQWNGDNVTRTGVFGAIGSAFNPSSLVCSATQSPCWKLIARIGSGPLNPPIGIGNNVAVTAWTNGAPPDNFDPKRSNGSAVLANMVKSYDPALHTPTVAVGFGGPASKRICGDTNACSSCFNDPVTDTADVGLFFHGDHWHFKDGTNNREMPFPAIWVMEAAAGKHTALDGPIGESGVSGPYKGAIFAQDKIDSIGAGDALCCPFCDCSALGNNTSVGSCNLGMCFGGGDATVQSLYHANLESPAGAGGTPGTRAGTTGTVLKSMQNVQLRGVVVGDVRASDVDVNSGCHIGNVIAYGPSTCGGGGTCANSNICFSNNVNHVGDLEALGSIDGDINNPSIWGNVVTHANVCFKNNAKIEGTIEALGTAELKNNALLCNDLQTSAAGTATQANPAFVSFMEASW